MTKPKHKRTPAIKQKNCPACGGTGVTTVKQPTAPGQRVYPPRCGECGGKGRVTIDDA